VFLGNPSPRVRDELWNLANEKCRTGEVIQIWSARTPSGFQYRQWGAKSRWFEDFDGLPLIVRPLVGESTTSKRRYKLK
jgi:CRISPR-associated protein Cas2